MVAREVPPGPAHSMAAARLKPRPAAPRARTMKARPVPRAPRSSAHPRRARPRQARPIRVQRSVALPREAVGPTRLAQRLEALAPPALVLPMRGPRAGSMTARMEPLAVQDLRAPPTPAPGLPRAAAQLPATHPMAVPPRRVGEAEGRSPAALPRPVLPVRRTRLAPRLRARPMRGPARPAHPTTALLPAVPGQAAAQKQVRAGSSWAEAALRPAGAEIPRLDRMPARHLAVPRGLAGNPRSARVEQRPASRAGPMEVPRAVRLPARPTCPEAWRARPRADPSLAIAPATARRSSQPPGSGS
jgi:hypothetical protein